MFRSVARILHIAFVLFTTICRLLFAKPAARPTIVREGLEKCGGTFIKFGQVLALRPDLLPIQYCYELFRLLDRVPPFSYRAVRQIAREDFGLPPEEKFETFEQEPLASASFGQVHLATLPSGEKVAVKIQRPGIGRLIASDLRVLGVLSLIVDMLGIMGTQRLKPTVDEFARWTLEELDYTIEARHNERLHKASLCNPTQRVPRLFRAYTSRRVLTNEFLAGDKLSDVMEALYRRDEEALRGYRQKGLDYAVISERLWDNFGESVYVHGVFHADPHPANLIILKGNIIGYVDFGIVGRIDASLQAKLLQLVRACSESEYEKAAELFLDVAQPTPRTDILAFKREYIASIRAWVETVADESAAFREKSLFALLRSNIRLSRRFKLETSPDAMTYFRTLLVIDSVTLQLAPEFDSNARARSFFQNLMDRQQQDLVKRLQSRETYEALLREHAELATQFPSTMLRLLQNWEEHVRVRPSVDREYRWREERARNARTRVIAMSLVAFGMGAGLSEIRVGLGDIVFRLWVAGLFLVLIWLLLSLRHLR